MAISASSFSAKHRNLRALGRGLTIIYYGDGKGKTTAALGAVLRAVGQGWHCAVFQFIKGTWPSSERAAIPKYLHKLVTIEAGGKGFVGILGDRLPRSTHKKQARALFRKVQRLFREWNKGSGQMAAGSGHSKRRHDRHILLPTASCPLPNLLILDELLDAVKFGFVTQTEVVHLIKRKPEPMHLIITGHQKFPKILAAADLITRMTKEKHPFDKGLLAVRGLDF